MEEWRPVVGYEGLYEVNKNGDIRSVDRYVTYVRKERNGIVHEVKQHVKEHVVKQGRQPCGYADVPLSKNGITTINLVHRIIAQAWVFNPDPERLTYVNHKDLDKTNNSIENLEWVSNSGNVTDAVQKFANPQSIPVYCSETDKVYSSIGQAASALNISHDQVRRAIRNEGECEYTLTVASDEMIRLAKLSTNAKCGWKYNAERKGRLHKIKRVFCVELSKEFDSLEDASSYCNLLAEGIRNSIRNGKSYYGLTFKYLDENTNKE